MKKINLAITINAPREAVWDAIVNDSKFRQWTSVFTETSYFEGSWNKGDTIRFLAINEKGEKEGMVSEIAESRYPEYISIKHLGYIVNGVDDTTSEEIRKWAPAFENYTLETFEEDKTLFKLDMDVEDRFFDMFMELWPKALAKLKEVSETDSDL
jgi:translation elongation factor EF-4